MNFVESLVALMAPIAKFFALFSNKVMNFDDMPIFFLLQDCCLCAFEQIVN